MLFYVVVNNLEVGGSCQPKALRFCGLYVTMEYFTDENLQSSVYGLVEAEGDDKNKDLLYRLNRFRYGSPEKETNKFLAEIKSGLINSEMKDLDLYSSGNMTAKKSHIPSLEEEGHINGIRFTIIVEGLFRPVGCDVRTGIEIDTRCFIPGLVKSERLYCMDAIIEPKDCTDIFARSSEAYTNKKYIHNSERLYDMLSELANTYDEDAFKKLSNTIRHFIVNNLDIKNDYDHYFCVVKYADVIITRTAYKKTPRARGGSYRYEDIGEETEQEKILECARLRYKQKSRSDFSWGFGKYLKQKLYDDYIDMEAIQGGRSVPTSEQICDFFG